MPEHLTFFGEFTNQTEALYWSLQELYALERNEDMKHMVSASNQLPAKRIEVRERIRKFRELLNSIEREHGLEPEQVIRPT